MNRKFLGVLTILAGLLILVGVVYVVFLGEFSISDFFGGEEQVEEVTEEQVETGDKTTDNVIVKTRVPEAVIRERPTATNPGAQEIEEVKTSEVDQFNKADLQRMAASFAERFGSYSNHSNFSNIVDLKVFMSSKMEQWADSYVFEQRKKGLNKAIYFGITTKSVSEEVKTFDDDVGVASILVSTRRQEYTGSTSNLSNTYDQDVLIKFVNERGAWKIDDAVWQEKY